MNNKKGVEVIDTVFSMLVYVVFLMFTALVLSINGCLGNDVSQLKTEVGEVLNLKVSEELSAYLRTDMPGKDALLAKINAAEASTDLKMPKTFIAAKDFLDKHPEVYVGKTYAGFITSLYEQEGDVNDVLEVNDVFDVVTVSLFHRKLFYRSKRDGTASKEVFYFPKITVMYGKQTFFYDNEQTLFSDHVDFYSTGGLAFIILPTYDKTGVTVKLQTYRERASEPTA